MATLTGQSIASTYALLLKIDSTGIADDGTLRKVEDGDATDSALSISDVSIAVDATDKIFLDGGTHSYIHESASDVVQIVAGGTVVFEGDTNSRISLSNNDSGTSNTIFGKSAGASLDAGSNYNVFIGEAVSDATMNDATNNVGIGYSALSALTTGDQNVAIGHSALLALNTGSSMVAIGRDAGAAVTDALNSVIIGQGAGLTTTSVQSVVIIGNDAGAANMSSDANGTVAIGSSALTALTSGAGNVAIGYQALDAAATSDYNTAVGHQALSAVNSNDAGNNTAVGYQAGLVLTSGEHNVAIGSGAGDALLTGSSNTAVGAVSLSTATTALQNTAVGFNAMSDVAAAVAVDGCVAIGYNALLGNASSTTGINGTVAIGKSALYALTSGAGNVAVGYNALDELTTGNYNTALGHAALHQMDGGEEHMTAVGYSAGDAADGNTTCTFIGSNTDPNTAGTDNETVIGYNTTGAGGTNTVTLGNASVTDVYMSQDSGATVHCAGVASSDDIVMADGKGIDFAAYTDGSVAGSTTSQILKDYEEGTWVPEFRGTTGSAGASDTTVNGATYTKIGRQVFIECYVTCATIGDWTGDSRLSGLPYQASSSTTYPSLTIGYIDGVSFQSGNMIVAHVLDDNTQIRFYEVNDNAAASAILVSSWDDGDILFLSGTYTV
jgi:hypothetical protein